jgi:hypothetical protein
MPEPVHPDVVRVGDVRVFPLQEMHQAVMTILDRPQRS